MQKRAILHYCQKCRAGNPLGQEFCFRCGTRLMLVVQPASARVDLPETTPHEEYLLERLTALENILARVTERLEQGLNLLLRQSESAYTNHALVKSLIEVLSETGALDNNRLEQVWRAECDNLKGKAPQTLAKLPPKKRRKARRKTNDGG